jgi:predicted metal-dependent phosphoesterase TrpH/energy-coupling factor transporter ATP-binding protein EcfA2
MTSTSPSQHNARGSLWHRWDLHFHTPSSPDYENGSVTNQSIVDGLVANGIRVVAITDHHRIDVARIRELQQLGQNKLTVLPGIELRDDHGDKPIHYICIFPEDCDLDHVWTTFQGALGLTATAIRDKGGDDRIYVPIEKGAEETRKLGGVVSIHAGAKSNSIEGIENKEQFQQRIKFDITKNWVDLMEIGQLKDVDAHLNKIFPATGLEKPLIICSDNHNITKYVVKSPLWFRADPTFRGLLMVLREPQGRVFIGERPPEHVRIEQNPTKYIRGISFQRKLTAPAGEKWFSGSILFNPGLVAIVGNKGSGKSALSDMLGLLGASKNADSFSFLSKQRFRHPTGGYASHFDATLEWASDEKVPQCLADSAPSAAVERLKYLPQDHVEKVCNELAGIGERNFEQELKAVIFSHVPESLRLGQTTLDELVRFQTGEKQKRIDSLIKQLRDISRSRSALEAQADPNTKRELQEKLKRRELELEAHDKAKPAEKTNPAASTGESPPDPGLIQNLTDAEKAKKEIEAKIAQTEEGLRVAERRSAVAKRLLEKIDNFQKEFDVFLPSLTEDAEELGLKPANLVSLTIKKTDAETIRDEASATTLIAKKQLDETNPQGLKKQLLDSQTKLSELQTNLDAPNRAYQTYLKELSDWQIKRTSIEGTDVDTESLKGLKAALAALNDLPTKIASLQLEQSKLALQIHVEKLAQAAVYRTLYEPVQKFIDTHKLAKDKLKLEFRAELTNEDFSNRLLALLALNRRGSFMGVDEGKAKADSLVQSANWSDKESVRNFLQNVDKALHFDQREAPPPPLQLRDQLLRGKKPEEVFDLLYGLEYVEPRYILRWEGKEISMLSPGERGTLLLVFYLLIDKGDMPLVIDQPEGNLDNHTVAKVLVDCIREARKRRQVFIVTHNPNLAVVCDADQIVYASMDKSDGNAITYTSGALENPTTSKHVTDVLEGTRWAFGVRGAKYEVGS